MDTNEKLTYELQDSQCLTNILYSQIDELKLKNKEVQTTLDWYKDNLEHAVMTRTEHFKTKAETIQKDFDWYKENVESSIETEKTNFRKTRTYLLGTIILLALSNIYLLFR